MIIPELSTYLTSLGGAGYEGLIISLFTLTAMISRPFSGKLADTIGRVPVMMFGSIVCVICSFIYPWVTTLGAFLFLRLVHGFSTGFTPTGQSAYLSDIVPAVRRGEAMGLLGTAGTVGMAFGYALGGTVTLHLGLQAMFFCSTALAIVSVAILAGIRETLQVKRAFGFDVLRVSRSDVFEPRVLTPCLIMALCSYAYGAIFTLMPHFGRHVGIRNNGLLFVYFIIASFLVRFIGGKASDRWGRKPILRISTVLIAISMMIIAKADTQLQLIVGVTLYGFAQGATSPTLLAWATDLSDENRKGKGIGSLYMFMELGIGIGAFASGLIFGNQTANFFVTFSVCCALAVLAFIYLGVHRSTIKVTS